MLVKCKKAEECDEAGNCSGHDQPHEPDRCLDTPCCHDPDARCIPINQFEGWQK